MKQDSIITQLELNCEDRQKASAVVTRVQDSSPSDASVFLFLNQIDGMYVGSLMVRSQSLDIEVEERNFDIENLLDILNTGCKDQIHNWRKTRKI